MENHEWTKRSPALAEKNSVEPLPIVINEISRLKLCFLPELLPNRNRKLQNQQKRVTGKPNTVTGGYSRFVKPDEVILSDIIRHNNTPESCSSFTRAGPREKLFFNPKKVIAGIVTCGGLCPGLNNVIRDVVRTLIDMYDVKKVYGFLGGYGGIYTRDPLVLDTQIVDDIQHKGGTILSSSRGGFDAKRIFNKLKELGVNQIYLIGGDGTMRGAQKLAKYALDQALANPTSEYVLSVAGVPKTIDNDIDLLDRSFGFNTAVTEALHAIDSAKTEAKCVPNGIGVVKLMGRHAGYIAAHACLASGDCDLCLIPEVPVVVDGENNILDHLVQKVESKGHAVVIVAEGAGEEILGKDAEVDAGGNRKLPAIGYWLKLKIREHFESKGIDCTVKYVDPSYMIRSVRANASDALFCLLLSQNVVHGTMAGYTGFCVGLCNNRTCYLPMDALVKYSPRQIDVHGRTYERVLSVTGQPRHNDGVVQRNKSVQPKLIL
eukprot:maker-scaffold_13-snap-gene-9.57-mRNA-1 protein AED:0.01 eAED:0.01 QI:153/1/1/1/1/1/2/394/489